MKRIWEFERGFIGPSVYSHYLSRFGIEDHRSGFVQGSDKYQETQEKIKGLAEARKKSEEEHACAIIGGPIVVALDPDRGGPAGRAYRRGVGNYSMFVAISKSPKRAWSSYISDCVIYELSESSDVLSMFKSPQMIRGEAVAVTNGGIVWAAQNDTLMKFAPSKTIPHGFIGGSGNDLITKSPWIHQSDYHPSDPWLDALRLTTRVAFGKSFAAYVPAGGYVSDQADRKFEFPITILYLSSGLKHEAILELPFDGAISKPQSKFPDRNDRESRVNPYLLGISDVRGSNDSLDVTLRLEEWSATMTFDMSHLLSAASPPQSPKGIRHVAPRIPPQGDAKVLINELLRAIDDHDMEYVRILLKAGADPNGRTEMGWSPLTMAAHTGTAEIVDELIAAGANIHLQDEKLKGATPLMMAAESEYEATRKIKTLLKAGVNVNATNAGGKQTALMRAICDGRLIAAAVLLSNGADPQVRDENGDSLVRLAKESHVRSQSMIELLKKHGVSE